MQRNCPLEKISRVLLAIFMGLLIVFIVLFLLIRLVPGLFSSVKNTPVYLQESTAIPGVTQEIIPSVTPAVPTESLITSTLESVSENLNLPTIDESEIADFNVDELGQAMLSMINDARRQAGLGDVEWDAGIAEIAASHAEEMAQNEYISHWDLNGYGPDVRYNLAGGSEWARENVYISWQRYDNGDPVPVKDWYLLVQDGHDSLMNSPGHRENIMEEGHTHVGIGFAYNEETGFFSIAQEFVNRYVEILNDPPREVSGSQDVLFEAKLLGNAQNPIVNLFYEEIPQSMTVDELGQTSSYISPSIFIENPKIQLNDDGTFSFPVHIDADVGIYHVMIWVDNGDINSQAIDYQIWVH